jgi:hypothetical protein
MNGLSSMIVLNIVAFLVLYSILLEVHQVCLKSTFNICTQKYSPDSVLYNVQALS